MHRYFYTIRFEHSEPYIELFLPEKEKSESKIKQIIELASLRARLNSEIHPHILVLEFSDFELSLESLEKIITSKFKEGKDSFKSFLDKSKLI